MLLLYIVIARCFLSVSVVATTNTFDPLPLPIDWHLYCPHSSICTHQPSEPISLPKTQKPCCDSCSCDPDCGLKRNCCLYSKDRYRIDETYKTTCTALSTALDQHTDMYKIVDKCPNMTSCYDYSVATWGSMYPVTVADKELTFLNEQCAFCHGEYNITKWNIEVTCGSKDSDTLAISNGLKNALVGHSDEDSICSLTFLPPSHIDITYQSCFKNFFQECPFQSSNKDFEALCKSFNASFTSFKTGFANIYCLLCQTEDIPLFDKICESKGEHRKTTIALSFLLVPDYFEKLFTDHEKKGAKQHHSNDECGKRYVVEKTSGKCRRLICPEGQIEIAGACSYVSQEWTAGPFVMFVKLEPVTNNDKFPLQEIMQLHSYQGKFFNNKLRKWSRNLFYSYLQENSAYVKFFMLIMVHERKSLDPRLFFKEVEQSMETIWSLALGRRTYNMRGSVNNQHRYTVCLDGSYLPFSLDDVYPYCSKENFNQRLHVINFQQIKHFVNTIYITKFFFCDHVYLRPHEYTLQDNQLFLNITNTTLQEEEFAQFTDVHGNERISVCVSNLNDYLLSASGNLEYVSENVIVLFIAAIVIKVWSD